MAATKKTSAGCLLYRRRDGNVEVLLEHMGGPFWVRRDDGSWSIPKGEYDEATDDPLAAARREFAEELGSEVPSSEFLALGSVRQRGGKLVTVWAAEGDFDPATLVSNTFEMEWPKGSGKIRTYPEVDRAAWFDVATARTKILASQLVFLERLVEILAGIVEPERVCDPA